MKRKLKVWTMALVALGSCVLAVGDELYFEGSTQELEVGADSEVLISVGSEAGDIRVVGEDRESIEVTLKDFDAEDSKRNTARLSYTELNGSMRVKLELSDKLRKSDITLRVPQRVAMDVSTVVGDLRVEKVRGDLDVSSVVGDVELIGIEGGIVANSVNGDIRLELVSGAIRSPISLVTVEGDVLLLAPEALHADFSVSTIDGSFKCEVDYKVKGGGKTFWGAGLNMTGQFGEGGPPLTMKTIDGSIVVDSK